MSQRDVIIACDFDSAETTLAFLDKFVDCKPFVKIGMELYYAAGPAIVKEIKARGHKIFLDLKLHDIPNTVKKSMAVLSKMDVDMCNLHAAGTIEMMKAALEGPTSYCCYAAHIYKRGAYAEGFAYQRINQRHNCTLRKECAGGRP